MVGARAGLLRRLARRCPRRDAIPFRVEREALAPNRDTGPVAGDEAASLLVRHEAARLAAITSGVRTEQGGPLSRQIASVPYPVTMHAPNWVLHVWKLPEAVRRATRHWTITCVRVFPDVALASGATRRLAVSMCAGRLWIDAPAAGCAAAIRGDEKSPPHPWRNRPEVAPKGAWGTAPAADAGRADGPSGRPHTPYPGFLKAP